MKFKFNPPNFRTTQELVTNGNGTDDDLLPPNVPTNVKELFGLHHFFLDTLFQQKCGEEEQLQALREMRDTVGRIKVLSLFSGVGGAELSVQQIYLAVKRKCEEKGLSPPDMPESLLSCDCDPACQDVLSRHLHPSRYIVDDMMRFLSPK